MLATSPTESPRLHSSPSSTSIRYRRPSNPSSYSPHQNASSSPRIGSLRRSQNSSPSRASTRVRTRDASTQYSPQEQEPQRAAEDAKGKGPSITSDGSINDSAMSGQQNAPGVARRPPDITVPESPITKRTSGDASLSLNDSTLDKNPPKRAKAEFPSDKVLPARYELCDTKDLVVMLSTMIADLVRINDPNQLNNSRLTRFHSRVAPGISAQDYLQRLATHLVLEPVILLTMCFYMDRLCSYYSEFTVNSLTCHRFLITAATVATKGLSDAFWNNSTYARVGGVKLSELALLELEFLYRVDWRIIPDNATLTEYYQGLITRTAGYSLAPTPPEIRTSSVKSYSTGGSTQVSDDSPVFPSDDTAESVSGNSDAGTMQAPQGNSAMDAVEGSNTSIDSTAPAERKAPIHQ